MYVNFNNALLDATFSIASSSSPPQNESQTGEQRSFLDLQQLLLNRPPAYQHIGLGNFARSGALTVCDYLERIKDIQDGFNSHEQSLGATMSAYLGVSACAMFTNMFALAIFFNASNLRRPRNNLIVLHSFTDAFHCAFVMPITLLMTFHFYWYLDELSCKAASFLKAASFYSSYMTLAALGAHQFISYHCKFNVHWLLIIYVVSAVFALPYVLAVAIEVVDFYEPWNEFGALDRNLANCNMTRPRICAETQWSLLPIDQSTYLLTTLALMYLLPIGGLCLSYYACARVRYDKPLPQFCGSTARNREDLFVFTFLIALYLLGWLPMTVFTILHLRGGIDFSYNRYLICQTIGVSTSIIKPICYGLTNRAIREMYVDSLRCLLFPCGLCARPQRTQLRRLIRLAVALPTDRSSASSSVFDSEEEDWCDEVFVRDVSSYTGYRTWRLPPQNSERAERATSSSAAAIAATRQQSLLDRRVVHPNNQRRWAHNSVR